MTAPKVFKLWEQMFTTATLNLRGPTQGAATFCRTTFRRTTLVKLERLRFFTFLPSVVAYIPFCWVLFGRLLFRRVSFSRMSRRQWSKKSWLSGLNSSRNFLVSFPRKGSARFFVWVPNVIKLYFIYLSASKKNWSDVFWAESNIYE